MASHPELSFHNLGINGIPSRVVIQQFWHPWYSVQSCHAILESQVVIPCGISGNPFQVVIQSLMGL
eukprot:4835259-Amphidinium_carterae.1